MPTRKDTVGAALLPTAPAEIQPLDDADLRRELAGAARFFEARHSENTRVAYARGWKAYTAWCRSRALDPLNTDAGQVCAFLAAEAAPVTDARGNLVRPGRKVNTLELRVAAIKHHLREAGASQRIHATSADPAESAGAFP